MQDALRRFKADLFQALAHPTRVAILEHLSAGELSAGELIGRLGVEQANASQHLAVLRSRFLVVNRKVGNQVFYSVRDPLILEVLKTTRQYFHRHLAESMALLDEIKQADSGAAHSKREAVPVSAKAAEGAGQGTSL
jgi:ArsR family transcriptional regulator